MPRTKRNTNNNIIKNFPVSYSMKNTELYDVSVHKLANMISRGREDEKEKKSNKNRNRPNGHVNKEKSNHKGPHFTKAASKSFRMTENFNKKNYRQKNTNNNFHHVPKKNYRHQTNNKYQNKIHNNYHHQPNNNQPNNVYQHQTNNNYHPQSNNHYQAPENMNLNNIANKAAEIIHGYEEEARSIEIENDINAHYFLPKNIFDNNNSLKKLNLRNTAITNSTTDQNIEQMQSRGQIFSMARSSKLSQMSTPYMDSSNPLFMSGSSFIDNNIGFFIGGMQQLSPYAPNLMIRSGSSSGANDGGGMWQSSPYALNPVFMSGGSLRANDGRLDIDGMQKWSPYMQYINVSPPMTPIDSFRSSYGHTRQGMQPSYTNLQVSAADGNTQFFPTGQTFQINQISTIPEN